MRVNPVETGFEGLALYPELLSEGSLIIVTGGLSDK